MTAEGGEVGAEPKQGMRLQGDLSCCFPEKLRPLETLDFKGMYFQGTSLRSRPSEADYCSPKGSQRNKVKECVYVLLFLLVRNTHMPTIQSPLLKPLLKEVT